MARRTACPHAPPRRRRGTRRNRSRRRRRSRRGFYSGVGRACQLDLRPEYLLERGAALERTALPLGAVLGRQRDVDPERRTSGRGPVQKTLRQGGGGELLAPVQVDHLAVQP